MDRGRNVLIGLGLLASSTLLVLLALEGAVRLFVPRALWVYHDTTFDWQADSRLGWVNKPSQDYQRRHSDDPVRYRTNPDGLIPHDARREKEPGTVRIMVFGDSMVVGRAVPQNRIYTAQLEAILRGRGVPADVVNAGVLGYSTDQALLLMGRWVPVYQPDVVFYGSTLNDFGGNSSREAYSQEKPMFVLEEGDLRLIPPEPSDGISRRGGGWRFWLQHSAFYRMLQPRIFTLRAQLGDWRQQNLLGLMQEVYVSRESLEQLDWALYRALVGRMQQTARAHRAGFLLFAHPEVAEVWEPYIDKICERFRLPRAAYDERAVAKRIAEVARNLNVPFLPVIEPFREQSARGPFHLLPRDAHLNAAGHRLLAELLAEHLIESGLVD